MTRDDPGHPLRIDPETMRRLGYAAIDRVVEHLETLADGRVTDRISREEMEARFGGPPPETPGDAPAVLDDAVRGVLAHGMRLGHPRFFAYIPSPNNFVSVLADVLAAGFNPFGGTWQAASGPSAIERITLGWIRDLLGLPATTEGLFVSGGSMANLLALATAREAARETARGDDASAAAPPTEDPSSGAARPEEDASRFVVYASDQTHSSVERALRTLGFAPDALRTIASDERFELPAPALARAVAADRERGLRPLAVVANAGTTNTGAVDPLPAIADVCRREGLWLHADGAYGVAAILTEEGRRELTGIDRVDSVSFDPHKWWFQPVETACLLVREGCRLEDAFSVLPAYLRDTRGGAGATEVNFCDQGLQLTRTVARALRLWMSIRTFGLDAFRRAVDHGFATARYAEERLRASATWDIVTPARMAIVTFRYAGPPPEGVGEGELHARLVQEAYRDGTVMLSGTTLADRSALRLCTIHPGTTERDVDLAIDCLGTIAHGIRG